MKPFQCIFAGLLTACALTLYANAQTSQPTAPSFGLDLKQDSQERECLACHDKKRETTSSVDALLARSVHEGLACRDCHTDSGQTLIVPEASPFCRRASRIACAECHEDVAHIYTQHGRLRIGANPDTPTCWDCHGRHDILEVSNESSHVHRLNLPDMCRSCHANLDLVKRHFSLRDDPIRMYSRSVHGRPSSKGRNTPAICTNCHSAKASGKQTAHRILSSSDPESPTHHFSIPDTCGVCHEAVTKDFWEGIHGQQVRNGSLDAPVCTHCHGEHGIISPSDPLSPVSAARLAQSTCSPCHDSEVLNQKYGLSGGQQASYIDSYHGLKSSAGDTKVANCASCHGSHRILPSSNTSSSIHPDNLKETCGECHQDITTELARSPIHQPAETVTSSWPEFFRQLYIALIVGTIGLMLLHNGADWLTHVRALSHAPFIQRLSAGEVVQHWLLAVSFTFLVITGFSLRFAEAGWVKFLFGWTGGFEMRGLIHRASAIVIMFVCMWHGMYALSAKGRKRIRALLLNWNDFRHIGQNVSHYLGFREEPARYGEFSYVEKSEYWALAWGMLVMTVTGILLWFDNYFISSWFIPRVLLDVALVIHYYEAWLAFLAILVWHMYGTIFNPAVYPMNPAWITGKMPKYMYKHEHPEGPKIRGRTMQVQLEEDEPLAEPTEARSSPSASSPVDSD